MGRYSKAYLGLARSRKLARVKKAGAFIISAAACLVFIMYVSQRVRTVELGYGVETLKEERAELGKLNEMLKVEVATLSSPTRIERVAGSMLGMRVPVESQVIVVKEVPTGTPCDRVDDGRLVRNTQAAGPATGAGG